MGSGHLIPLGSFENPNLDYDLEYVPTHTFFVSLRVWATQTFAPGVQE